MTQVRKFRNLPLPMRHRQYDRAVGKIICRRLSRLGLAVRLGFAQFAAAAIHDLMAEQPVSVIQRFLRERMLLPPRDPDFERRRAERLTTIIRATKSAAKHKHKAKSPWSRAELMAAYRMLHYAKTIKDQTAAEALTKAIIRMR